MSKEDISFAQHIKRKFNTLMGEFVVIDHGTFSWIKSYTPDLNHAYTDIGNYKVAEGIGDWITKKGQKIHSVNDLSSFGANLKFDKNKACFVCVDASLHIVNWSTHSKDIFKKDPFSITKILKQQVKTHNANRVAIIVNDVNDVIHIANIDELKSVILDIVDLKGSYALFQRERKPTKTGRVLFEPEAPYDAIQKEEIDELDKLIDDFLKKDEKEPVGEEDFGGAENVPPPDTKDPEKINSWFRDQVDIVTKTLIYHRDKPLNTFEKIVTSPEWWQQKQLRKLVKIFTRTLPETYHLYFNELDNTTYEIKNSITRRIKALKFKGISLSGRLKGATSKEYKFYKKIVNEVDTQGRWRKPKRVPVETHYKKIFDYYKKEYKGDNFEEVFDAFMATRLAYDKGLELQQREMERSLASLGQKQVFKLNEITFGDRSTKAYGKQELQPKDTFDKFFTITYKKAHEWDLPVQEGVSYTVGHIEGKPKEWIDVHTVNFKKEIFDEADATAWWKNNKKEIAFPVGETSKNRAMRVSLKSALAYMGSLKGTYAPRIRDAGEYIVVAEKEKVRYRNHRPSRFGANRLAKKLEKEGWKNVEIQESKDIGVSQHSNGYVQLKLYNF